ncbi:Scarecrow-like protein 6 [Camellia lanceoleosa]|uniref:Scarecrow-like protein 6 n=1 Tax=Camellia lanceoleosa TaxID=1840588 RepID=A0ACC0FXF2_9ERIC|nr:Scarecrow-like protein 6 [Camellia lanceoleosa]
MGWKIGRVCCLNRGQDQSILQWIATEFDDGNVALAAVIDQGSTAVDGGSNASPVTHFMNFTSNQAILEALGYGGRVHIIDFDIGFDAMVAVHRSGEE